MKINELKEKMCYEVWDRLNQGEGFKAGFDAAMELQANSIPAFFKYLKDNYNLHNDLGILTHKETGEWQMESEIYMHFLKNIYQPEK